MATKATKKKARTKKQHTPDYYPVQRSMPIGVDGGSITGTMQSDAGRCLSQYNRRLYRYGMNYQIKLDLDVPGVLLAVPVDIEVYALRNTWDTQRAFALAKKTYDEAYADERNISSQRSRWEDFRVTSGVSGANTLQPVQYDNASLALGVVTDGEFANSQVDKAGTDTFFTWGVAAANSLDIMDEWNRADRVTAEPAQITTTAPYDGVNSDDLSDIEMENLGSNGNLPPYSQNSPTDMLVKVATIRFDPAVGSLQRLSTGYFDAPCGLFVLKTAQNIPNGNVILTVKSGQYKGVAAHAMCN